MTDLLTFQSFSIERVGCGIKQNDFLVVMVTKAKKAKAPAPAPAAPTEAAKATEAAPASKSDDSDKKKESEPATASAPTDAAASATTPKGDSEPSASAGPELPQEAVNSLTAMGFPEAEVRHCLRAANGNPDIAVEFLTNGTNSVFIHESKYINFIWLNSILKEKLNFNLGNLF